MGRTARPTSRSAIGSVLYNSRTNKFFISIPEVGSDLTAGGVAVMNPVTGQVTQVFSGLNNCMPSGMAQGPGESVLVTCDPEFPAPDPVQFAPRTYVINGSTGAILANLTQVGGVDYGAYNPTDHHYYLGARDFFTSSTATTASPVYGSCTTQKRFPSGSSKTTKSEPGRCLHGYRRAPSCSNRFTSSLCLSV